MEHLIDQLKGILKESPRADDPSFFTETINRILTERREHMLESARTFATPQYFLDRDALRKRAAFFAGTMRKYIPASDFFYAFKCNDLPALAAAVKEENFQADVAGLFELKSALRLGFERILFSGPGKSAAELRLALKERERVIINIDNFDELLRLKEMAGRGKRGAKALVGFRVNSEPAGTGQWSKFGFRFSELKKAIDMVRGIPGLDWAGLHFHCSWNKNPRKYAENIALIGRFIAESVSPAEAANLRFLDIGGGFYPENQAVLLKDEDKAILTNILAARLGKENVILDDGLNGHDFRVTPVEGLEHFAREISAAVQANIFPLCPGIRIYMEPGRFIAAESTSILLAVTAIKEDGIIVDGGINMLGDYKFSEYSFAPVVNLTRPSTVLRRRLIYGPLCDPSDLWGYSYYGDEVRKGDILAVLHQGAYTFSTAWRFIKAIPAYIMVSGDTLSIARKGETFAQRYAGCRF